MSRIPEPGSRLEDAGVPDLQDSLDVEKLTGTDYEQVDVTHDRALASEEWGTTAEEQREGEPLDARLRRELPDDTGLNRLDEDAGAAGRLVEPDEGARTDTEKDTVARDVGVAGGGRSAEERAMHLTGEP